MIGSKFRQVAVVSVAALAVLVLISACLDHGPSQVRAADESVKKQAAPKGKRQLSEFMRKKLSASSQVLEGLCTEDFKLIRSGAESLQKLSRAEQWRVSTDTMYRQHSVEFNDSVDKLIKAAKDQKLDSAALAWTKTTLSCIECHQWVRAVLISDLPDATNDKR